MIGRTLDGGRDEGSVGERVLEARDPRGLAGFYSELLGQPISKVDDDWVDVGEPPRVVAGQGGQVVEQVTEAVR